MSRITSSRNPAPPPYRRFLVAGIAAIALAATGCSSSDTATIEQTDDGTEPAVATAEPIVGNPIDDDTLVVVGLYRIDPATDDLIGEVPENEEAVFERFAEIIDVELRETVTVFAAIDSDASDGTDGVMQPNALEPGLMVIALDTTGVTPAKDLDRVIVHEYAHLLTLAPDQVPEDFDSLDTCPVYGDEGCPLPDSYAAAFFDEFWPGYVLEEIEEGGEEAAEERWASGEFVTEYAATLPYEDLAEVFAEWVLLDTLPQGDSIVDQKLRFFEQYPEVVEIKRLIKEDL